MSAPHTISIETLLTAVWPNDDAGIDVSALQSHISRLRGHLGRCATRLERTRGGYRLRLDPGGLDAACIAELAGEARSLAATDPASALEVLHDIRRRWEGSALEEFIDIDALSAWRRSLEEQRLAIGDLHAEVALSAGRVQESVEVAAATVSEDGLRGASVLLLMRALAVSGRAPEALRVGHTYRRRLKEETGLDPSPALATLEHRIATGEIGRAAGDDGVTAEDARAEVGLSGVPRPATPARPPRMQLVGRDAELAGIARLCQSEPLVTLVGPGGVGKTTLALEAARRDQGDRRVGIVALASVHDDRAVIDAVAAALGLRGDIGDPLEATQALLKARPWLLALDNCEHILRAVSDIVTALTVSCPELTVLATSRQRLDLPVEQVCRVAPLAVPSLGPHEELERVPAVAMFVSRAKRVRSDFEPDDDSLASIAAIVRRLDGMPLAIELAAGRLASLGLGDLSTRLDDALDLLTTGRGGDERHSSLRAATQWSYDLLGPEQQRLFRALSVFPDGFDLATAESITGEVAPSMNPTDTVADLVETSMLAVSFQESARYRMLETLRAFGLDQLAAHHENVEATERFVRWVQAFAQRIDATILTAEEPLANKQLLAEFGNLRAAWHLARSRDDIELMVSLIIWLYTAFAVRDLREFFAWALELVDHPHLAGHPREAHILAVASTATWRSGGDLDRTRDLAERAMARASEDDELAMMFCHDALGTSRLFDGRFDEAIALFLEAADKAWGGLLWTAAGYAAAYAGRIDEGRAANADAANTSCPTLLALHHYAAGGLDNAAGEWASAQNHYREALRASELAGTTFLHGVAAVGLVTAQAAAGDTAAALTGYADLVNYWEETGASMQQWTTLRNLAALLERLDDADTAALLRDGADTASEAARPSTTPEPGTRRRAMSTTYTRFEVIGIARHAIARHLADLDHEATPTTVTA